MKQGNVLIEKTFREITHNHIYSHKILLCFIVWSNRPIYLQHRKKKEDNKQKEEDQTETPKGKPWKMMDDVFLQVLLKEAKESIIPLSDEREQCAALAR